VQAMSGKPGMRNAGPFRALLSIQECFLFLLWHGRLATTELQAMTHQVTRCVVSDGCAYPTLQKLMLRGLVAIDHERQSQHVNGRFERVFRLTERGRVHVAKQRRILADILNGVSIDELEVEGRRANRTAESAYFRDLRRAEGLCSRCGKHPPKPGRTQCFACLDKKRTTST